MRQSANNSFKDGMNLDLHPLVTPDSVLTDNLNGTFITYDGNEFCLQNDRGNKQVASLSDGFTPIGAKEFNGVIYIVSTDNENTEIGIYPGFQITETNETLRKGKLNYKKYTPLRLIDATEPEPWNTKYDFYGEFNVPGLGYRTTTPVTIEIQPSYDGSVNLILVADGLPPRIINSGFSVLEDGKYAMKTGDRNQSVQTNLYTLNELNEQISLIRTNTKITNIDLIGVQSGGQFKGGNYTFYVKFGDADYNQTDVVAESSIVSVFKGNDGVPSTISGTLQDERTDKMVGLKVIGLNHIYSKIYIYFTREYSDTNGFRLSEAGMFTEPINMIPDINVDEQEIWLTGFETIENINVEALNIDYHTIDYARAEAQNANMLFLANVGQKETFELYKKLKEKTLLTNVEILQGKSSEEDDLSLVAMDYSSGLEYYSTHNIYYNLGYWPDEIYRFGIVYILSDGSTTPAFNMRGNISETEIDDVILGAQSKNNDFGVFLTPKAQIITNDNINPLYFKFTLPEIEDDRVTGWFVVRQKRIPRTICQGLTIGTDKKSHLPMLYNRKEDLDQWEIEGFLSYEDTNVDYEAILRELENAQKKKNNWWKGILGFAISPIIGTYAFAYTATRWKDEKDYINYIKSKVNSNKPKLEYLTTKDLLIELDYDNIYFAIKDSNFVKIKKYSEFSQEIDEFKEQHPGIYDDSRYTSIAYVEGINDPDIYYCEYSLYKYQYGEDLDPESDTGGGQYIDLDKKVILLAPQDNLEYPDTLNIIYNYDTREVTVIDDIEEAIPFYSAYIDVTNEKNQDVLSKIRRRIIAETSQNIESYSLLSLDPCVVPSIGSMLDGSKFTIIPEYSVDVSVDGKMYKYPIVSKLTEPSLVEKCAFISSNTVMKMIDKFGFSNIAGTSVSVSDYKQLNDVLNILQKSGVYFSTDENSDYTVEMYDLNNVHIVRGEFSPYIGVASKTLTYPKIYSIRHIEPNLNDLFIIRKQDNSEYYCVSKRYDLTKSQNTADVFQGDCYTNTVTMRIIRNFIDSTVPYAETIVDEDSWAKNVLINKKTFEEVTKDKTVKEAIWDKVNISDVNTVDLGMWATFKCLSSYNLGLRSEDTSHVDETAIMGTVRSFYPLNGASCATGNKVSESYLLNDGLSATVGEKRYNLMPDVPYQKNEFVNRIIFSNIDVTGSFSNGYRTFQGLSYHDYDKQYGAITKILSWGTNLFVVMEHGLALVPVNEKALMQTTTGDTIHIYGHGVLPDQMSIISQDFGSKYEHSVIRTPIGVYGIDTDARKIWRFSDKNGFETLSDMKIESYLNDNLFTDKAVDIETVDVRAHYNSTKGDVMFTFYNKTKDSNE